MDNSIITRLLEDNTAHNNQRVLQTISILLVLIIPVTMFMKLRGWTSPGMTIESILLVTLYSTVILIFLNQILKRFGKHAWTQWLVMLAIWSIFLSFRSIAYHAVETHALMYLIIILSVFYFDYKLVLFAAFLCIAGDYLLLLLYPASMPQGGVILGQGIRYLNYLWSGLAAALGTRAIHQLLHLSTKLKSANDLLQQDIETERRMEKVRKEFIAAVSHELKSPLSIVQGYAEAVKDGLKPHKQEEYMDIIIDETKNMGELISNMLDLSQLENGYIRLNQQEFAIDALCEEILRRLQNILEEKNLQITLNKTSHSQMVWGDSLKIELCLLNLINNAIQHSSPAGTITISFTERENNLCFRIENEGSPIADDDLSRIWLPFYRTEKSRSKKFGGTGLGLTITARILDLHQSQYGAENTSKGVCFYFWLQKAAPADNSEL